MKEEEEGRKEVRKKGGGVLISLQAPAAVTWIEREFTPQVFLQSDIEEVKFYFELSCNRPPSNIRGPSMRIR